MTLANIAITNSLPTGSIVATIFTYRQYRHRGADEVLAGWAILASAGRHLGDPCRRRRRRSGDRWFSESSNLDLVGVDDRGSRRDARGRRPVRSEAHPRLALLLWSVSRLQSVCPADRGETRSGRQEPRHAADAVRATPVEIFVCLVWGLMNWMLDCSCLVFSFFALGVGVPWRGLLLAYGAGQLAANLPITPGGLGVVEGSITVALVAYGGAETSTVAAVFLYRIISFWGELPVGWFAWAWLARRRRRNAPATTTQLSAARPTRRRSSRREDIATRGLGRRGSLPLLSMAIVLGATVAGTAGCSAARSGLGTSSEVCFEAIPVGKAALGKPAPILVHHRPRLSIRPLRPSLRRPRTPASDHASHSRR